MKKILVTGAFGLVGSDLIPELLKKYGQNSVVSLVHSTKSDNGTIMEKGDVTNIQDLERVIKKHDIGTVYHLAGLLSAGSEKDPQLAWQVNYLSVKHMLDLAIVHKFKLFWPSSIGAYGPTTPKMNTPQHTIMEPNKMYGVTKFSAELLSQYYFLKYGVDVRSLRYPGLNGYKAPPGPGTTEYSVHIFYAAIKDKKYECFLKKDTVLPMMYIDDAIKGTIDLMEAPSEKIKVRMSYNFAAVSFAPQDLVAEIQKIIPEFTCTFKPDERQAIADGWPKVIDDSEARKDWGWKPAFDLEKMTKVMYEGIKKKLDK